MIKETTSLKKRLRITILTVLFSWSAWAAESKDFDELDTYEAPVVNAVENRLYMSHKDLTVNAGFLPLDAFYKAATLGLSYTTTAEKSYLGWEIFNAQIAFTQDTGLKKDLLENFAAKPAGLLEYVKYYLTTSIVYTPMYSKNLLFNKNVVYSEISLVGSAGMVAFNSDETAPLFGGGLLIKFFRNKKTAIKFDARAYYHLSPGKSSNFIINTGIGWSYDFGP